MEENQTQPTVPQPTEAAPVTPPPAPAPTGVATESSNGEIPQEIKGWNWGAFFLGWIWSIFNKVWIGLIQLVALFIPIIGPIIGIIMAIVLGLKGSEWAWKNRKFESVEQFKKVQKSWAIWGLVVFILGIILSITMGAALLSVFTSGQLETLDTTDTTDQIELDTTESLDTSEEL